MANIEMVLIFAISIFLLKYKYFIHNKIALLIFFVSGIISCTINYLVKINIFKLKIFLIRILQSVIESTYFCYQKYMMEKLYYPYWNVAFIPGIILLIFSVLLIMLELFFQTNYH